MRHGAGNRRFRFHAMLGLALGSLCFSTLAQSASAAASEKSSNPLDVVAPSADALLADGLLNVSKNVFRQVCLAPKFEPWPASKVPHKTARQIRKSLTSPPNPIDIFTAEKSYRYYANRLRSKGKLAEDGIAKLDEASYTTSSNSIVNPQDCISKPTIFVSSVVYNNKTAIVPFRVLMVCTEAGKYYVVSEADQNGWHVKSIVMPRPPGAFVAENMPYPGCGNDIKTLSQFSHYVLLQSKTASPPKPSR